MGNDKKWLRHGPTGNMCLVGEDFEMLKEGSVLSPTFDESSHGYVLARTSVNELISEDFRLKEDVCCAYLRFADYIVTGKTPTQDSIALWEEVQSPTP